MAHTIVMAYYYAKKMPNNDNTETIFELYNTYDKTVLSERSIIRLINDNKLKLINYHINPNNPNQLTQLRTNLVIPEEDNFQYVVMNGIINCGWNGKVVVLEHINKLIYILNQEDNTDNHKFIKRLLRAIDMYISYMHDVKVRIFEIVEDKPVKINKEQSGIDGNKLGIIYKLSLDAGTQNNFNRFKNKYKDSIKAYHFLVETSIELLNNGYRNEMHILAKILYNTIDKLHYTFLGEQLDKYFCNDILLKYKASVYDNQQISIDKITSAERTQKAKECVELFNRGYVNFANKIENNKRNIINAIKNSREAMELTEELNKLNSHSIDDIEAFSNPVNIDEYKEFIIENSKQTKEYIDLINKYIYSKKAYKIINTFSVLLDTSGSALLQAAKACDPSSAVITSCAGTVANTTSKHLNSAYEWYNSAETLKIANKLSDKALDEKLPSKIIPLIKRLKTQSTFNTNLILYCYEKALYMNNIDKGNCNPKFNSIMYAKLVSNFKKERDTQLCKINKYGNYVTIYNNSYLKILADMVCDDSLEIREDLLRIELKWKFNPYDKRCPVYVIENAWLSACRIIPDVLDYTKVKTLDFENKLFWKIVEDTFNMSKGYTSELLNKQVLRGFRNRLNATLGTQLIESKYIEVDIRKLIVEEQK